MNHLYEILADALGYPDKDRVARMQKCKEWVNGRVTGARLHLGAFIDKAATLSVEALQELYTQTFDLNPVCTLDIGYHLFGENYKRGELLARLRETEQPFELGQSNQLPDHLPVLLRLIARLKDEEIRPALIREILIPAVDRMLDTLGNTENPYRYLIEAISLTLKNEVKWDSGSKSFAHSVEIPELYRIASSAAMRR